MKRDLILLASVTNRGTCASTEEENLVVDLVTQLEALNPTANPAENSQGDWELCYSSTQSFRSSPFFLAIRALLGEEKEVAENLFTIHDRATTGKYQFANNILHVFIHVFISYALIITLYISNTASRVGKVRQIIDDDNKELISEYDLSVGLLPGLPVRVKGTVVTSSDLLVKGAETWEMTVRG